MSETPATEVPAADTVIDDYTINNNYLYPRFTLPPQVREYQANTTTTQAGMGGGQAYNTGLLRGWIYPIDMSQAILTAAVGASSSDDTEDAMARAIVEEDERIKRQVAAAMAAVQVAGQVPEGFLEGINPVGAGVLVSGYPAFGSIPKQIRAREGKQFQYNPNSIGFSILMNNTAPAETLNQSGTAGNQQVGSASTSVELLFDRTMETHAATNNVKNVNGHPIDTIFKHIGVQKDLWDVYRIILGGDKDYWSNVGSKLINLSDIASGAEIQSGSVTDMANRLFDLGFKGSSAYGRRIVLYYNPNVVILGDVTSIGFTYAQFNANYVPTIAKLDMEMSILSTTSESGIDNFANGTTDTTDTTDGNGGSGNETPNATAHVDTTVGRNAAATAV